MKLRITLAAVAVFLCLASNALAQPRPDGLLAEIARAVSTYSRYTVFDDVRAQLDGGVVTLSGKVTTLVKKEEIGRRVAALDGVTAVRNEIDVLAAVASDDDLRQRVARAIYSNAAFWRYAAMPTPPIRILVERGRVTLTGAVATDTERSLARSLASGHGESTLACELTVERMAR
jgi:osmotically-inducible protein OsmY